MVVWVGLKVDGNLDTEDPIESDFNQPWLLQTQPRKSECAKRGRNCQTHLSRLQGSAHTNQTAVGAMQKHRAYKQMHTALKWTCKVLQQTQERLQTKAEMLEHVESGQRHKTHLLCTKSSCLSTPFSGEAPVRVTLMYTYWYSECTNLKVSSLNESRDCQERPEITVVLLCLFPLTKYYNNFTQPHTRIHDDLLGEWVGVCAEPC